MDGSRREPVPVLSAVMSPRDRAHVKAYYASFGQREWERLERPSDGAVEFAVTTAALGRHLPPSSRILDIGGGPGRYAIWLAERGHEVVLADLSPELLEIARAQVAAARASVTEVVEADACDLSRWPATSFDAVLSLGPFYHLVEPADRDAAARELARVVRPGGFVFVAAIARLAYLQRTLAVPDERHHLLDGEWLRRLLEDGVFENDVAGRFSLGYGMEPAELRTLFGGHGFVEVELLSAESLSAGIPREVGEALTLGGPVSEVVERLLIDLAGDERVVGSAGHLLFVATKGERATSAG